MEPIEVLIAEDEGAVRQALAELVESDSGMRVAGTAADAEEAIQLADRIHPDIALVDVKMPGGGGPRAAREIRERSPETHVVALSAYEDRRTVLEMLSAGVVGYIVKGTPAEEILYTIRRSMKGQGSLSVEVTGDVIQELAILLERSETLAGELQELDRLKSELIQTLSHELFTPLTAIQGFALTVKERGGDLSMEEIQTLAGGVSRASDRISRLVGNLAALARLDREGVELSTRPLVGGEVVARALEEFPHQRDRVQPSQADSVPEVKVWADLDLAVRALVVLIDNALSLSPEEEPVDISLRAPGSELEISVADRGPGVSPELRGQIFAPFTQGDATTTRIHQGLGIGLYLARRIMSAHGGKIDVSPRPGGGSVFVLEFPVSGRL
ncbi:MAG: ATP-binding protein [Actinomycetota bacterium]